MLLRKETKILDFRVVNQDVKRKCFDKGRIVDALGKPEGLCGDAGAVTLAKHN